MTLNGVRRERAVSISFHWRRWGGGGRVEDVVVVVLARAASSMADSVGGLNRFFSRLGLGKNVRSNRVNCFLATCTMGESNKLFYKP